MRIGAVYVYPDCTVSGCTTGGKTVVVDSIRLKDPITNAPHTSHTTYDVPLYVVGEPFRGRRLRAGGRLADIAPTAEHRQNRCRVAQTFDRTHVRR